MGAAESQPAAAEVSTPSADAQHDMDAQQWTEEFSKEYQRLRQTELGAPEGDQERPPGDAADTDREGSVPLKEMMGKRPVHSREESRHFYGDVPHDADEYEQHGQRKRPRPASSHYPPEALAPVSATGDPRNVPVESGPPPRGGGGG
jgi:hypothetical protein